MFSFFRKKKKNNETLTPDVEQSAQTVQNEEKTSVLNTQTAEIEDTPTTASSQPHLEQGSDFSKENAFQAEPLQEEGLSEREYNVISETEIETGEITSLSAEEENTAEVIEHQAEEDLAHDIGTVAPPSLAEYTESNFSKTETQSTPTHEESTEPTATAARTSWINRLSSGLKKTGQSITEVFTGTKIDDVLYEELETALLVADAGVAATHYLLEDVKQRVKDTKAKDPAQVRALLAQSLEELLKPLEAALVVGKQTPTVIMVAGVNGAGKTTSIGKLTRHLASANHKVLLAAGDTFRAAAREQLEVWADRNQVEIVAQEGGDPASVSFDAVSSGKAKKTDVVIIDTAGRLATQPHLMEELKKIRRVIGKAMPEAPHEVLLVVDGNTGQNALAQVKAFDEAIQLTGLVVTKLDGTAKGGVMAAIALWSQERVRAGNTAAPIYFIGVGEQVEDLQSFNAKEFANALLQT